MGIIISVAWRPIDRSLDTPAGDVEKLEKRIGDYLEKVKSDEWIAKAWSGREARNAARAAGLPVPEVDNNGDIRARLPEEMLPPVVIADNNVDFEDFEGGIGYGQIVSQAFREAVESLDRDVHQFVPVEVRRPDGRPHDKRPFYFMRVTRLLDTINLAESPKLRRVGGNLANEPVTDTTTFHLGGTTFAVHSSRVDGMGLWRDVRSPRHLLASQQLIDRLKARGLTGWRPKSTFTEH